MHLTEFTTVVSSVIPVRKYRYVLTNLIAPGSVPAAIIAMPSAKNLKNKYATSFLILHMFAMVVTKNPSACYEKGIIYTAKPTKLIAKCW